MGKKKNMRIFWPQMLHGILMNIVPTFRINRPEKNGINIPAYMEHWGGRSQSQNYLVHISLYPLNNSTESGREHICHGYITNCLQEHQSNHFGQGQLPRTWINDQKLQRCLFTCSLNCMMLLFLHIL